MQETETQPVAAKTYFSTARNMMMHISAGTKSPLGTVGDRAGEKIAQFMQVGDFSRYVTDDPETIAYLDKQIASGRDDLLTPEQYQDRITPDHVKLNAKDTLIRQLTEKNRLMQEIMDRNRNNK